MSLFTVAKAAEIAAGLRELADQVEKGAARIEDFTIDVKSVANPDVMEVQVSLSFMAPR